MNAISIEGLEKRYGTVRALDGLDLEVEPGTVFGFLGPNGAGKTTTIRILTGLSHAGAGHARVAGVEVGAGDDRLAHLIGHLPEEPAFYTWMTPVEFLDHVGRIFGLRASQCRVRTQELLELVGLAEAGKRRIGGFSRGMRQRLGLAQALVNHPQVIFLDEPLSALDPAGRRDVLELITRLKGETTVLMSTHILADVERVLRHHRHHQSWEDGHNGQAGRFDGSVCPAHIRGGRSAGRGARHPFLGREAGQVPLV